MSVVNVQQRERLLNILTWKRDYGTASEMDFINEYLSQVEGITFDIELNLYVKIGESETIFSCHTDTVHRSSGKQKIFYAKDVHIIGKTTNKKEEEYDGECLGSDDGVGIWIMLNMIEVGVPGLYIFHRGEECGGIGSSYIHDDNPELLKGYKRAIAFDRRGDADIITHQAGQRCCSNTFAWALSSALNICNEKFKFQPSPGGVFTDTANYVNLVPECTNISVGYEFEHSVNEILDYAHAQRLSDACCIIDWEALPTEREPVDEFASWTNQRSWGNKTKSALLHGFPNEVNNQTPRVRCDFKSENPVGYADAIELCERHPIVVAEILLDLGVTYEDFQRVHEDLTAEGLTGYGEFSDDRFDDEDDLPPWDGINSNSSRTS